MKPFELVPSILEYTHFADFARAAELGKDDLLLTSERTYHSTLAPLQLGCQTLFCGQYGAGEPTDVMADAILNELRGRQYDRIIAVGGGTIIDLAKVVAVAGPTDTVDTLYDRMSDLQKMHKLLIVPTTCGSGSEVTNIAILNRTTKGVKMGMVSRAMFADEAVLIAGMLESLPYKVYATSSIDAMIHAAESYLSPHASAFSMLFSEKALSLIVRGWRAAVVAADPEAGWKPHAADFLRAACYAGIAFGYAGCAAVHALSYPLGGVHHIPHGQANQLLFSAVMRKYQEKQPIGKLNGLEALLADALGTDPAAALNALYTLMDTVLQRDPLHAHGITADELPVFSKNVHETQQRLLGNNYVPLTEADILDIYQRAF